MQMIDLMQRLAELDAGNPNIIHEGQGSPVLQQLLAMQQKYRGTQYERQLGQRVVDQQWREANGKGAPVDAAGRPIPVLSPEEFEKKNPNYLKPGAASGKPDMMKPMADAGEQAPLSESMDLTECGMMPMPGMGGQPHTPASISMTANSGPELSGMLADIMKLAGVHQVEPEHMGIEPEHDHGVEVISAEPTPLDGGDKTEIMRSMMDRMNGEMDDEEEADEGMYDNSPADPEPPAPFDANEFAHRENQPGQGDRMDGDKPKAFATMEEQLMADWKQFMTEGVAEGSQPIFTPKILPCAKCGAKAHLVDWDFRGVWRVMCDNNHTTKGENITKNRAVHKWNNLQNKLNGEQGVAEGFDSAAFDRHMEKLRAQKELEKTDPMRAMINKMKSDDDYKEKSKSKHKQDSERQITDPFHSSQGVNIGEQGVAKGKKLLWGYHIVDQETGNSVPGTPKFKTREEAKSYLMTNLRDKRHEYEVDEFQVKEGMAEDLDANQKRVGQLGPYEKVGPKGAVGKLVGANENFINSTSQAVTTEGVDELAVIKRLLGK